MREQLQDSQTSWAGEPRKITLPCGDPPINKSFTGHWLVGNAKRGIKAEPDESGVSWGLTNEYSIALTKRGKIVVYERKEDEDSGTMVVFDSFDEMRETTLDSAGYPRFPENVIAEVAAALGRPYEVDLDI